MKTKVKFIISFLIIGVLTLNINIKNAYSENTKPLKVDARNAIAIDRESKTVLFEQNGYELVPMASTTKILTALITIEREEI